jgi:hypothetical protein
LEGSIAYSQDLNDNGIVLSLRDDQVWASWIDGRAPIMLGDHHAVLTVMRDFIGQSEIGERLVSRGSGGSRTSS